MSELTLSMNPWTKLETCVVTSSSSSGVGIGGARPVGVAPIPRSASATTTAGATASASFASRRWNVAASICVRVALAVVWFTSDLDPRKML